MMIEVNDLVLNLLWWLLLYIVKHITLTVRLTGVIVHTQVIGGPLGCRLQSSTGSVKPRVTNDFAASEKPLNLENMYLVNVWTIELAYRLTGLVIDYRGSV